MRQLGTRPASRGRDVNPVGGGPRAALLSTPRAPSSARTVRIAARCGILQLPDPAAQKDAMTFAPAPRPGSAGPPPSRPRRPLWHWLLLSGAGMALLLVAIIVSLILRWQVQG